MPKSTDATEAVDQAERRGGQQTHSTESVLRPMADARRTMFSEAMRAAYDTTTTLLRPTRLGVSLRVIEVVGEQSRHVLDFWLGTTQQTQRAALEMCGLWARHVERMLEPSEQTTERVTDRITREAEQVAEDAQAAAREGQTQQDREAQRAREQRENEREQTLLSWEDHNHAGTAIIATATASGYCMKCKVQREMNHAKQITMKNGRPATEGTCPVCSTKIFKIGAIK